MTPQYGVEVPTFVCIKLATSKKLGFYYEPPPGFHELSPYFMNDGKYAFIGTVLESMLWFLLSSSGKDLGELSTGPCVLLVVETYLELLGHPEVQSEEAKYYAPPNIDVSFGPWI